MQQKLVCSPSSTSTEKDQDVLNAVVYVGTEVSNMATWLTPQPLPRPSYVGVTASVDAQIIDSSGSGTVFGLPVAKKLCSTKFGPDAHMCTMDELYSAVVNGTLKSTDTLAPSWVYMPNWNTSYALTSEALSGLADTCGGYTVRTGWRRWFGILAEWSVLPDGTPGLRWHGGDDAYCGSVHPIACCQ